MQLRLKLVAGRRLDEIDLPLRTLLRANCDQLFGIGRPEEQVAVAVFGSAVAAQGELVAASRADPDVVLLDESLPAAVGRLRLRPQAGLATPCRLAACGRDGVVKDLVRNNVPICRMDLRVRPLKPDGLGGPSYGSCFAPSPKRPRFGLVGLFLGHPDFHRGVVILRDFQSQRMSLVIDHQPDVSGIGVLLVLLARAEAAVALPFAVRIEPKEFHLARRAVDEGHGGIVARAPAGPRPACEGLQGLPRTFAGVCSGGLRRKLVTLQIAPPPVAADLEIDVFDGRVECKLLDRQATGRGLADLLLGQGLGQFW